jgi:hypothetical protein
MTDITELLEPSDFEFYRPGQKPSPVSVPGYKPQRRDSPEQLLKALNVAHNNIRQLVTEKDQLKSASLKLHQTQKLQLKLFLAAMGVTWTIVGWVLKFLIPYAVHGMAK